MSVELSPATQLGFPRPLTQLVKKSLLIHNPNSSPIAFKVKTTAPKQYCVRPNSGRVEPGENVEVQVLLQPLQNEPPPHAKCKDKFLVQSAFITPDEEMRTLGEMWAQTEKTNKSAINEQKIKCAYLPAEDGSNGQNGIPEENEDALSPVNGDHSKLLDDSQMFAAAESSPTYGSYANGDNKPPVPPAVPDASPSPASRELEPSLPSLSAQDIGGSTGVSPTNAALELSLAATTSDSDKLNVALKEVDRLRAQLAEAQGPQVTGLRRRGGTDGVRAGAETAVEKTKEVVAGNQGVPIEVVGALMLAVFALTYLFF